MNRFLVGASAAALLLALTVAVSTSLGYRFGNLMAAIFAVPLITFAIALLLIVALVIVAELIANMLLLSMRTWGRNSGRLRLLTRHFLLGMNNPPDTLLFALLIASSTLAVHLLATIGPKLLTSPGIAADFVISIMFWVALNKLERFAEKE